MRSRFENSIQSRHLAHGSVNASLGRETDFLQEYRTRLTADVVTGKLDVRPAAAHLPAGLQDFETSAGIELSEEVEPEPIAHEHES